MLGSALLVLALLAANSSAVEASDTMTVAENGSNASGAALAQLGASVEGDEENQLSGRVILNY